MMSGIEKDMEEKIRDSAENFVRSNLVIPEIGKIRRLYNHSILHGTLSEGNDVEVYILTGIGRSKRKDFFDRLFLQRGKKKDRTYFTILVPRSNDSTKDINTPYLKQYSIDELSKIYGNWVKETYPELRKFCFKGLNRLERMLIEKRERQLIDYFNPDLKIIETDSFSRLPKNKVIPPNDNLNKNYNSFLRYGNFIDDLNELISIYNIYTGKNASAIEAAKAYSIFLGIQEGIHNRVHLIRKEQEIKGKFKLVPEEKGSYAKIIPYKEKASRLTFSFF